ncbi:MAG: DUF2062 domain-containing protein [Desulfobacterales bacterium]|nr:DUF2062 domain-containing protein [Desulfobacterales bacterium]
MKFEIKKQLKYLYVRLIRLRGEPHALALGMAFGIFAGMMPIMPFQTIFAVALAMFFKGSKITAALGTWVSNPLVWYFLYYYSYKLGALILGLPERSAIFSSIMTSIQSGEELMVIVGKILGSGTAMIAAFLAGGLVMGTVLAIPSYFFFLHFFRYLKAWRKSRKERKNWRNYH